VSNEWMPREQWDKLVVGDNPLNRYANAPYESVLETEYGFTVADLERSRLQLSRNQYVRGYCILVAKKAVREPHQMYPPERALFFDDMVRVGETLEKVFQPIKINYEILGNAIPHLHVHIVPRYYGDPAPGRPINPGAETVNLADDEYWQMVGDIREALGFIRERVNYPMLTSYLDNQGRVLDWPSTKHAESQMAVRKYLASKFEVGRRYTEREVNDLLNEWALFNDWAMLRRELFMHEMINRLKDGSAYWLDAPVVLE
jgi:diadenosine tetraphosphate (Ap4A) HIT family hydrolase